MLREHQVLLAVQVQQDQSELLDQLDLLDQWVLLVSAEVLELQDRKDYLERLGKRELLDLLVLPEQQAGLVKLEAQARKVSTVLLEQLV